MKIRFLGYASNSFSNVNTVSFLLYKGDNVMMVDCGTSITHDLHSVVENFCSITSVYISHSHFDHFLGLPYFIIGRHLDVIAKKKKNPDFIPSPLVVYLPLELIDVLKNLIAVCHKDIAHLSYDLVYRQINEEMSIEFENASIVPFRVNHTVETYGFSLFENEKKILSYTSDTLYDNDVVDRLMDSQYLILEGMVPEIEREFSAKSKHATFQQAKMVVQIVKPQKAFVVHLQPRYQNEKQKIIDEINTINGVDMVFPDEDVEYVLCV